MSLVRFAGVAGWLLFVVACAEGATGAGAPSGGSGGSGGNDGRGGDTPAGSGGAGQGGTGGDGSGASDTSSQSSGDGDGDGGSGGNGTTSTSSSTSSDASSSAMSSSSGGIDPGTIYFSEYMEGDGNNKALEIYNAGSTPIDLGACHLEFYQNGASSAQPDVPFEDTSLASGAVYVICQSNFAQPGKCDRQTTSIQHSGDDAIALVCDGSRKDVFGTIGTDPGSSWGGGVTSSENSTLRRKCSVLEGDTNGSDAFDPAIQWDGFGMEIFTDLGQYTCP